MLKDTSMDLLQELSNGEDEFDVDLMACGCRLVASNLKLSIDDIVRLYELGEAELKELVGALIDEASIPSEAVFRLAAKVAKSSITPGASAEIQETIVVEPIIDSSTLTTDSSGNPDNPPAS